MKIRESDIQKSILKYLHLKNIFAFSVKTQGTYDPKLKRFRKNKQQLTGVSDIIGIHKGRFLAIEVKGPKGRTTEAQDRFLEAVSDHGGIAFVARSIEDVSQNLQREG